MPRRKPATYPSDRELVNRHTVPIFYFGLIMSVVAGQNAAPSSHMTYRGASFAGDILVNDVRVPKEGEALYTYYETLGWGGVASGYAGIQAHPKAHNFIFSIWDHQKQGAPIRAVYRGPGTLTVPFGGEGTGLKSWNFELGWDTDVWYTLVARCWPVGDHTFYGYWVRSNQTKDWTHMVTMDVAAKNAFFRGSNDAFIEDWLETGAQMRSIHLREGWKRRTDGHWHAFDSARYSVNPWDLVAGKRSFNFRNNWNGGVAEDEGGKFYFMTAGGASTQPATTNPSTHSIARTETKPAAAAIKIQTARMTTLSSGKLQVAWQIDAKRLPQFSFSITAHDESGHQKPVVVMEAVEPHTRRVELTIPEGHDPSTLRWQLSCRDIFDNESAIPITRSQ
jgi:hypothetical protein